jgi:hypothetical protein
MDGNQGWAGGVGGGVVGGGLMALLPRSAEAVMNSLDEGAVNM